MALEVRQAWDLSTTSTAGAAVNCYGFTVESRFYLSGGASSTGSIGIQTANNSSGPWAVVSTGVITAENTAAVLSVTGPLLWVRPVASSIAGTLTVEMVSAS